MSNSIGTGFSAIGSGKSGITRGGLPNIPILGVNIAITHPNNRYGYGGGGGGLKGFMPPATSTTNKEYLEYENIRFSLTNAWNTRYKRALSECTIPILKKTQKPLQTPFRVVNNAGDLLLRQYYSCGGSCQTFQSRPNMKGLRSHFGAIQSICDGSQVEPASCNQHYVYDSSDYVRYKKQAAVVKNFNDLTYGSSNNGAYTATKAIRRF